MRTPVIATEPARTSGRQLKRRVAQALGGADFGAALEDLLRLPARQVVNPLFGLFCHREPRVRWRAVTAMGAVLAALAEQDMESARVVVRRFMWNLNEESGGIGWGCPEALGESLARSARLSVEYHCILVSYLSPCGNFLDHPALQEGVLWGMGRLAHARPGVLGDCGALLAPFFAAPGAPLRGLAAWTAGAVGDRRLLAGLEPLLADTADFTMYRDERLTRCTVASLARTAVREITARPAGR
jgi:hypothetical protein